MPTYYHVSPEKFDGIVPRYSTKLKRNGIYLAPSMKAILESWGRFVLDKRKKSWRDAREKKLHARDADERRERDIKEPKGYQTLYLYKVHVPHALEKPLGDAIKAKESEAFDELDLGAFGPWGWDEEIFVPEEYVRELRIEGCRKLTANEFDDWTEAYEKRRIETVFPKTLEGGQRRIESSINPFRLRK